MAAGRPWNHLDATAMRLDEIARDRQAEAGTLGAAGRASATTKECIEDRVALFQWNARARIDDVDLDFAAPFLRQQRNHAPRGGELDRIAEQVVDDGAQLGGVRPDRRR